MPDEVHGYLPGWIIKETIIEPGTRTLTRGSKISGAQEKGDYDHKENGGAQSRTLEDAGLVGETLAEVILADGGEVSPTNVTRNSTPTVHLDPKHALIRALQDESSKV